MHVTQPSAAVEAVQILSDKRHSPARISDITFPTGFEFPIRVYEGAEFNRCQFPLVVLKKSFFQKPRFVGCRFIDCEFDRVQMDGVEFEQCVFLRTLFHDSAYQPLSHLRLQNCSFQECAFVEMHFRSCAFAASAFRESDFRGCRFNTCIIDNVAVTGSMDNVAFCESDVLKFDCELADVRGLSFVGGHLGECAIPERSTNFLVDISTLEQARADLEFVLSETDFAMYCSQVEAMVRIAGPSRTQVLHRGVFPHVTPDGEALILANLHSSRLRSG